MKTLATALHHLVGTLGLSAALALPSAAQQVGSRTFVDADPATPELDLGLLVVGQGAAPLQLIAGQVRPLVKSPAGLSVIALDTADANGQIQAQFQMPLLPIVTGTQNVARRAIALPAGSGVLQTAPAGELVPFEQDL